MIVGLHSKEKKAKNPRKERGRVASKTIGAIQSARDKARNREREEARG